MKKFLLLTTVLLVLFSSCKKSSSSAPSGVTATLNGKTKTFGAGAIAAKTSVAGITDIEIIAAVSATTGEAIDLSISNGLTGGMDSIVAGTYSDTSTRFTVDLSYDQDNTGSTSYDGGTSVGGSQGTGSVAQHVVITISSITSNSIKGTFSGDVYLNGDPTSTLLTVTSGSFNLALQKE